MAHFRSIRNANVHLSDFYCLAFSFNCLTVANKFSFVWSRLMGRLLPQTHCKKNANFV